MESLGTRASRSLPAAPRSIPLRSGDSTAPSTTLLEPSQTRDGAGVDFAATPTRSPPKYHSACGLAAQPEHFPAAAWKVSAG